MALTSLSVASRGLLSRGSKPALQMASRGYLISVFSPMVTSPGGGGLIASKWQPEIGIGQARLKDKNRDALALVLAI